MRKFNTFNKLLSRVKSIFGRNPAPEAIPAPVAEPPTDISVVSDPRLSAAFADIEKYLADNYGTPPDKLRYETHVNGVCLYSKDLVFAPALVILEDADGLYNLPDNVLLVLAVTSTQDEETASGEIHKFFTFLAELCLTHSIQHFAVAFSKDKPDHPATVRTADVFCIRLY